jgi:endonuclease/exonuclease/phosphatase family metal-dependent hydrolase
LNSVINRAIRKTRRCRLGIVAVVALVAALLVPAPSAQAAQTSGQRFMQFNFCGAPVTFNPQCSNGTNTYTPQLANKIANYQPGVVLLEEICHTQLVSLVAATGPTRAGYPMVAAAFTPLAGGRATCPAGDQAFGNAILVKSGATFTTPVSHTLVVPPGSGGSGRQQVTCTHATGALAYTSTLCVTHISPAADDLNGTLIPSQIADAYNFAYDQAGGQPLLFGGDFNAEPQATAFDGLYSASGQSGAHLQEVDQCASPNQRQYQSSCNHKTHNSSNPTKKLDYIFMKKAYFKGFSGSVVQMDGSDHLMLRGEATICNVNNC